MNEKQEIEARVPNNANSIAKKINALNIVGLNAVSDDGAVILDIDGDMDKVSEIAKIVDDMNFGRIGDGVQYGSIWINSDKANFHDEIINAY